MLAAQYLQFPEYTCLVTRLNYAELTGPDSIWENLLNWTCDTDRLGDRACESHSGKLRIKAPSGATIWFKAFDSPKKKQKVKSESYDRIINDEASELEREVLTFLYRSLRNNQDSQIPLSMVNLSNPGGPSTDYLVEKYVDGEWPYYPLDWRHNPHIDQATYSKTLDNLDYIDQRYQKYGDWHYRPSKGDLFPRTLLEQFIDNIPDDTQYNRLLRGIDFAASKKGDRSAFTLLGQTTRGSIHIKDVVAIQDPFPENTLLRLIDLDNPDWKTNGFGVEYYVEKEPGSSGIFTERYIRELLADHIAAGLYIQFPPGTNNKFTRARPLALEFKKKNITIQQAPWNDMFLHELGDFGPDDREYEYDDIVDATSHGFNQIRQPRLKLRARRRRT